MLEECQAQPKPENAEEAEAAEVFKGDVADQKIQPGHTEMFDHRYNPKESSASSVSSAFQGFGLVFIRVHSRKFAANVFCLLRHALDHRGRRSFRSQFTLPACDAGRRQAVADDIDYGAGHVHELIDTQDDKD